MQNTPRFIGRSYGGDEKEQLIATFDMEQRKGSEKAVDELEKTPEEAEMILAANSVVDVWLGARNIKFDGISPERVHILTPEAFKHYDENPSTIGFYRSATDAIFIARDPKRSSAQLLSILVHELLHRCHDTSQKLYATPDGKIANARSGFQIFSPWKDNLIRLRGFNEIVLVYCQSQILNAAAEFLEQTYSMPAAEWRKGALYPYMRYARLLDVIVKRIAAGSSEFGIYEKLIRGQFSDTMLSLRDIDRVFGKGSLRILGLLGTFEGKDMRRMDLLIEKYFVEPREEVRKKIKINVWKLAGKMIEQHKGT